MFKKKIPFEEIAYYLLLSDFVVQNLKTHCLLSNEEQKEVTEYITCMKNAWYILRADGTICNDANEDIKYARQLLYESFMIHKEALGEIFEKYKNRLPAIFSVEFECPHAEDFLKKERK